MYKSSVFSLLLIFTCFTAFSQNENTKKKAMEFEASYIGENFNNLSGGIKTGSNYLGMANIRIGVNTKNTGLWKGGMFYINAANTHGATPSGELTGDFQVASNIEAGNHTFLQELWFKQSIGPLELTAGLQDLNMEFVSSEHAGLYLNSSFGIIPTISVNVPTPIFPLTGPGISLKWQVSERIAWLGAVYDGCPTDFENNNPYNLRWDFKSTDGALVISEIQLFSGAEKLPASYKIGFFLHNNHLVVSEFDPNSLYENNYGFYFIADHTLWQKPDKRNKIGTFLQLGFTPEKFNFNNFYIGAGLNYYGLLNKNGDDALGFAIAHAAIDMESSSETSLELTYQIPVTENIFVQPDFQYIINPSGHGENLDNSFSAALRFGLSF